jgi:pSer/pThr/pTyr-binding forkhead associated (FHA) protein
MSDQAKPTKPENGPESSDESRDAKAKGVKKRSTAQVKRPAGITALSQEAERLQSAAAKKPEFDLTDRLRVEDRTGLPDVSGLPFGTRLDGAEHYRKLPLTLTTANLPDDTPRWRIELEGLGPGVAPMGLDILGDAVIGRGRVGNQPVDLDLDPYGGLEQGVSRRHALLRPTANHLYVIDLGSTNGTMHNGLPLGPGIARSIKHHDTVTLGRLSFTVKIVEGPSGRKPAPAPVVEGDSEATKPLDAETGGAAAPYTTGTKTGKDRITPEMVEARRKQLEQEDATDESSAEESSPK